MRTRRRRNRFRRATRVRPETRCATAAAENNRPIHDGAAMGSKPCFFRIGCNRSKYLSSRKGGWMVGPQIVLFGGGGGVGVGRGFRTDTGPAHATRLHPIMDAYPHLPPLAISPMQYRSCPTIWQRNYLPRAHCGCTSVVMPRSGGCLGK